MEVTFRTARRGDLEAILPLWREMMDYHSHLDPRFQPAPQAEKRWTEALSRWLKDGDYRILVAEAKGRLVGYIIGTIRSSPPVLPPPQFGFISDICVAPESRRIGVGGGLYETLQEWFKERGLNVVQLNVAQRNRVSQAFWEEIGFRGYMEYMWKEIQ